MRWLFGQRKEANTRPHGGLTEEALIVAAGERSSRNDGNKGAIAQQKGKPCLQLCSFPGVRPSNQSTSRTGSPVDQDHQTHTRTHILLLLTSCFSVQPTSSPTQHYCQDGKLRLFETAPEPTAGVLSIRIAGNPSAIWPASLFGLPPSAFRGPSTPPRPTLLPRREAASLPAQPKASGRESC